MTNETEATARKKKEPPTGEEDSGVKRTILNQKSTVGPSGTNILADIATHLETPDNLDDAEAAAARFDTSPYRLWLLFQTVDENRDGSISKSELAHALSSASFPAGQDQNITSMGSPNKENLHEEHQEFMDETEEEEEQDDEVDSDDRLQLEDIQALDELWDRVAQTQDSGSDAKVSSDDEEKTQEHRNYPSQQPKEKVLSFPQFCRIIRYMWLQQLLNPSLDNPNDPESHYKFECVDYASGYYRHKTVPGNVSQKKCQNFFTAPRHGNAKMRWIDVPSGSFVPDANVRGRNSHPYQYESYRITILRLAVKYRFHPTSIEDAIDLEEQEPKVNSFEHSLLDLGDYSCGTISWLRHAGYGDESLQQNQFGEWASQDDKTLRNPPATPPPHPVGRVSSTQSFHSYHKETEGDAALPSIPDLVVTEGGDDMNRENGRHYFITIPMFELSRRSQTSLDLYNEAAGLMSIMQIQPLIIEVNESTLGLFVASQPDANLVVTCSTKWRPTRIKPFGFRDNAQANARQQKANEKQSTDGTGSKIPRSNVVFHDFGDSSSSSSRSSSDDGDVIQDILQDEKMSLERVKDLLRKRHSIQRHRNSSWLMHAIIDAVVDNLEPISKIYEAQLQRMSTRLFELQHRLSRNEVKEMIVMKRNLEWLVRELGPFARVLRHLIDDNNIGIEVTHYLEDVEDHLGRTLEELTSFANECVSLKDEYNAYLDRRMNDILYVLTVVTTLVVPGQFLTGYFGMNFQNEDGTLGAPLLNLGSTGLGIFWAIVVTLTSSIIFIMYKCNFFERQEMD